MDLKGEFFMIKKIIIPVSLVFGLSGCLDSIQTLDTATGVTDSIQRQFEGQNETNPNPLRIVSCRYEGVEKAVRSKARTCLNSGGRIVKDKNAE